MEPGEDLGLRVVREEAKRIVVHSVLTIATGEGVIHYGAASPGKICALLTSQKEIAD